MVFVAADRDSGSFWIGIQDQGAGLLQDGFEIRRPRQTEPIAGGIKGNQSGRNDDGYVMLQDDKKIINLKTEAETQITLSADTFKRPEDSDKIIKPKDVKYLSLISSNLLIYATDWEIYLFDAKENKHTLITRLSQKITSVAWRQGGYIVYSTDKAINVINLKDRENPTVLVSLEKISAPVLNSKGDTLYFTAKIGNQEGLYKLFIK